MSKSARVFVCYNHDNHRPPLMAIENITYHVDTFTDRIHALLACEECHKQYYAKFQSDWLSLNEYLVLKELPNG